MVKTINIKRRQGTPMTRYTKSSRAGQWLTEDAGRNQMKTVGETIHPIVVDR